MLVTILDLMNILIYLFSEFPPQSSHSNEILQVSSKTSNLIETMHLAIATISIPYTSTIKI